ncbi:anaerobic sulfatase maturase [Acinetobacter sp. UBA6720]|uniref:anaerobic sulfatase maturase n=1 Tax=Acinetobacter sp. UBA6720 TaxID=1945953 RepID=UPI0025C35861|nr:anaerobic sulfatase maturase [Acinetobacter sp. UBA6720]
MRIIPTQAESPSLKSIQLQGQTYRYHVMLKPSGAQCNLDCSYCFYLHKQDLLRQPKTPRMAESMLELHIKQYIEAQTGNEVVFSWQGGEPTLMGLEFFQRVVELQNKYKKPKQCIENDIQTNGTLFDEAWCEFLSQHNFLVGLSIDGPAEFHDKHRYNKGGKPTHAKVMHAVELLHHYQIPFNALCVVNRDNAKRPNDVYRFIRDQVQPRMIQFIPGMESAQFQSTAPGHWNLDDLPILGSSAAQPGTNDSVVTDWSIVADDWGYFLSRVWGEWIKKDFGRVFVDQFENIVSMMLGYGAQKCVSGQICGKSLAIEHNGDLFSCDHFVYPEYKLGNIQEIHQGDLVFSEEQKKFAYAKSNSLPQYCRQCPYLQYCWGDCPKDRFLKTPDGEAGLHYLCSGLKRFFHTALLSKSEIMKQLKP